MKKKILSILLILTILVSLLPSSTLVAADNGKPVRILFTHDIHSYLAPTVADVGGTIRERGGAARLATILKEYSNDHSIYVDGGDFSQGTLFQTGFEDEAYELTLLGLLGCKVTTFGNHEWDHGSYGLANMLNSALKYSETNNTNLPRIVSSNIDFSKLNLSHEELSLKGALIDYSDYLGDVNYEYSIIEVNGVKIGFFGLMGLESIEDAPTANLTWENYIDSAKRIVNELNGKCDLIVALSHAGTDDNGLTGEDIELLKAVPEINLVVSAHSHSVYQKPVRVNNSYLVSCGEYLDYVGMIDLKVLDDGSVEVDDYKLIPCDENVKEDAQIKAIIETFKQTIDDTYLAPYGYDYDQIIAHSNFDFINLGEMYSTHDEYPLGDLIADSYIYEAKKNGIDDIDVALVGLGTIRGSIFEGDITVADAFGICSLGMGSDRSSGHPLLEAYITGSELKLMAELDASLGPLVSSIKMSYSGMEFDFNTSRMLLDRVSNPRIVRGDKVIFIEDDKLYKVCCNMYAANMLGMLNGLTRGALTIVPKYADGTPIEDFYDIALRDSEGNEIKEWYAFADYLSSFEVGKSGYPEIPNKYASKQGRKNKTSQGGINVIKNPGTTTWIVIGLVVVLIIVITLIIRKIRRKIKAKKN